MSEVKLRFFIMFLILSLISPAFAFLDKTEINTYTKLSRQYNWLNRDLFYIINYEGLNNGIDAAFICAIIDAETEGKNVVSKKNRDGSRDYGIMQFNSKNIKKGDEWKFLIPMHNIKYGVAELRECISASSGKIDDTIRFYNQGKNGKKEKYKNWKYVQKVFNNYDISLRSL